MNYLAYAARRVALAVASVYLVVTVALLAIDPVMRQWVEGRVRQIRDLKITAMEKQRRIESLREAYNVDDSLSERLLDWWTDVPVFDWGESVVHRDPVIAVLDGRVLRTFEYVLPGLLIAVVVGALAGIAIALVRHAAVDLGARIVVYALLGVPIFMLLVYLGALAGNEVVVLDVAVTVPRPGEKTLAALAVAAALLAGQVRFARGSALERTGDPFVKMLRAKGVSRAGVVRHLLRNVAVPLLSLSVAELLGTLVLSVYVVEEVLGIDGLGAVTLTAARQADLPLLVGSILVVVYLGIVARLCRDLLAGYVDPRVRAD